MSSKPLTATLVLPALALGGVAVISDRPVNARVEWTRHQGVGKDSNIGLYGAGLSFAF